MQMVFENIEWDGKTITADANHNNGEDLFKIRLEGATSLESEHLELFTNPLEYRETEFAVKGAVELFLEVMKSGKSFIDWTGYVFSQGR